MTVLWFIVWLIANSFGDREPLRWDPVNGWAATLILAAALDLNRKAMAGAGRKGGKAPPGPAGDDQPG